MPQNFGYCLLLSPLILCTVGPLPQNLGTVYSYLPWYCVPWDDAPKLLGTVYSYLPWCCGPWNYAPKRWVLFTLIYLGAVYRWTMPLSVGYCLLLSLLILCTTEPHMLLNLGYSISLFLVIFSVSFVFIVCYVQDALLFTTTGFILLLIFFLLRDWVGHRYGSS